MLHSFCGRHVFQPSYYSCRCLSLSQRKAWLQIDFFKKTGLFCINLHSWLLIALFRIFYQWKTIPGKPNESKSFIMTLWLLVCSIYKRVNDETQTVFTTARFLSVRKTSFRVRTSLNKLQGNFLISKNETKTSSPNQIEFCI